MNMILPSQAMRSLPIKQVATHSAELKSFLFEQTFEAEPGQFVMLWIPGLDEKPFSVSDVRDGKIEITAKAVGPFLAA
jgi:dihydroorotate dehydrogenase electron transfer subunit